MSGTENKTRRQTPEVLAKVCGSLRAGLPIKRAAMGAGISERTFYNWRRQGWALIEETDAESDEALPFVALFALQVESALSDYIKPLIAQIAEAAKGKGRGDWRAAHAILAGRFPHEFSERVAVAKSQKVEVTGGVELIYRRRELDRMTTDELDAVIERSRIQQYAGLSGEGLDSEITKLESILSGLYKARDQQAHFVSRRKISPVIHDKRPTPPLSLESYEVVGVSGFEHAPDEILAANQQAPDTTGAAVVVDAAPVTLPEPVPVAVKRPGFGYDQHGLAIQLTDEDLSL